ncbi:MAG: hypothetical protein ACFBSD_12420 [Paracoccaceae bacterium]
MTLILFATFVLGAGAAGIVLLLDRLTGGLPIWLAPAAAGIAMLGFTLWNEYTWFERSLEELPAEATLAQTVEYSSTLQPWTLVAPRITRFAAVTTGRTLLGGELLTGSVILVERFVGVREVPVVFDCARARRAPVSDRDLTVLERGALTADRRLDWTEAGPDDPLIATACEGQNTN